MTTEIWKVIVNCIKSIENSGSWMRKVGELRHEQVLQLPSLGSEADGEIARPNVSEEPMEEDYLTFLREQIHLNARGPEWTGLLERRLAALEPFRNEKVLIVNLYQKPNSATLYINPKTEKILHIELY